jgi:hypothetical protein
MAVRTWRGTTNSNWGTSTNWLENAVPSSLDDVFFDASSPNCTVNGLARLAKSITFTGYTNILTMTFGITVSGNVTFIATQSSRISGAGVLTVNAASTITSNGGTWPNGLTFTGPITVTLSDALTVSGTFTTQTNTVTFNTSTINIQGSFTLGSSVVGTSTMNINGTGNQTWNVSGGLLNLDTDINKPSGNLIFAAGSRNFGSTTTGKTLTYTTLGTGTLVTTGATLIFFNCSVRSNGINWGTINGSSNVGNSIITLLDDMACNSITGFGSFTATWNGFNMNINGDIIITSIGILGSTVFNIIGTGSQSWAGGRLGNPVKINKSSGTFTMSSACIYGNGTGTNPLFEHISGPVVTTGSTFSIGGNCQVKSNVLDPNAIVFNNLGFQNQTYTATLIDNMTVNSFTPDGGGQGAGLINGNTLFIRGDITIGSLGVNAFFGGTTIFNISGTGNQTWNSTSTSTLRNSIVINKSSGTLNLTGTIRWGLAGNTLTYSQGVINSGTSTLISTSGTIFNLTTTGFSLYDWNPAVGTVAINTQPLVVNSNLTISGSTTFTGTSGWTCVNLLCSTISSVIVLQVGITYTTTNSATLTGTNAGRITMRSSAPTVSYAAWTLQNPATQSIVYVNGQGIDSNAGSTIWSFGGTINTSLIPLNWSSGSQPATKAFTFVS